MAEIDKQAQGRRNRRIGAQFERDIRKDMISKGWIVDKWTNNIDLQTDEIVQAKTNKFMARSCGFPDFIMFRISGDGTVNKNYELKFIECKTNNKLSKEEKMKMEVLRKMGHKCYIMFLEGKTIKCREFSGYENKS